jgi:hypothetical protein
LLTGNNANNILTGGAGNDTLNGGVGNDSYIVDSTLDIINEAPNAGIDSVTAFISYTLASNIENLTLSSSANAINGTGNNLNNIIIGNNYDNLLVGGEGNDSIYGSPYTPGGSDTLYGGKGDDFLYGNGSATLYGGNGDDFLYGGGGDVLYGGKGNDTYIVNLIYSDIVSEAPNAGIDTVIASFDYELGANLENLTLSAGNTSGTGNSLNNIIIGSSSNNALRGRAGNDSLVGNAGNDTLIGTDGTVGDKDTLTGGSGSDTFTLGNATSVFYDDRNAATPGFSDYALITDFNANEDFIRLNGKRNDYFLAPSAGNLPTGTAIFRAKSGEADELIAIIQGSTSLNLNRNYFKFTDNEINLSTLNGSNGFVIRGNSADDYLGTSVSNAGDVNGDGFDDFIIGAPGADPNNKERAGQSYVVFGAVVFDASLNPATLNGSNGFVLNGINAFDNSGITVSNAGDVNGDGFSDLIISTLSGSYYGQQLAGEKYVVFGTSRFGASFDLATLNGSNGFVLNGIDNVVDSLYGSISSAGDINGDGFDDLIIGASGDSFEYRESAGKGYVVFGSSEFNPSINLATLNGGNGFTINSIDVGDSLGSSVGSAGDVNGDGFDDLIIGASTADPNNIKNAGKSYVIFGKASGFNPSINLATLNGSNGFTINGVDEGDSSGNSVSSAGDVNGDGIDDLIIGAKNATYNRRFGAGESYVVFGTTSGFSTSLDLTTLNGTNGFKINGINNFDRSGNSVSSAGDVNGDGFDDLIIGAKDAAANGQTYAGESYVVFGGARFGANFDLATLNGRNGFKISGVNKFDRSGNSVSSAGDVNGDGFDDLIIGARDAAANGQFDAGESYVVFGRDFTNTVTRQGTAGDDTLIGTDADDILIGGRGNDRLIGGRGVDVLYGGAGNDTLSFGPRNRRMDGGSGTDTLAIEVSNMTMDLTTLPNNRISGIEIIDLTGTGNNSLNLTRLNLLNLSDTTNQLIVKGNAGDRITSTQQGWLLDGTTTLENQVYDRYTSGTATLLVDTDITRILS